MKNTDHDSKLGKYLGYTIRNLRTQHNLTIAEVSKLAKISRGMLSKIENGITSASLESLEQISNALGVTLSRLFQGYNKPVNSAQFVEAGKGLEVVRRGTKSGHTYHLLAYNQRENINFEPFLIDFHASEDFPYFEHPGVEFIYMLEGELEYRIGEETFILRPGDSLTFNAETSHRPEKFLKIPVRLLSIINHNNSE